MPSNADALLITAAAAQFSFFGESASYQVLGAESTSSIVAIAGAVSEQLEDTEGGRVIVQRRDIQVKISDVAAPARGDQVAFADNLPWTLETAVHKDAAVAIFGAVRVVPTEITTQHYRSRF